MRFWFLTLLCLGVAGQAFAKPEKLTAALISQDDQGFNVQLFLSDRVASHHQTLPFDAKNQLAARFFIDLTPAVLSEAFSLPELQDHQWIQDIRVGQNAPEKLRLVLDLSSRGEDATFTVTPNAKGVLITATYADAMSTPVNISAASVPKPKPAKSTKTPVRKNLRVVIDPGHGGADPGARGLKGAKEKDVVLAISKKVRTLLGKDKQYVTFMTRDSDETLKLLDRTRYANEKDGDLFVSVHANASPRRSARGVSTYFLNNADDQESLRVAMRENGELDPSNLRVPSGSDDYYLEIMKASMIKNFHTTLSTDLARNIQSSMMKTLSRTYSEVVDLGVRSARFYVLTGAKMPAVLVETSFISNPTEEKRLINGKYQDKLAVSIVKGIEAFFASESFAEHQ